MSVNLHRLHAMAPPSCSYHFPFDKSAAATPGTAVKAVSAEVVTAAQCCDADTVYKASDRFCPAGAALLRQACASALVLVQQEAAPPVPVPVLPTCTRET